MLCDILLQYCNLYIKKYDKALIKWGYRCLNMPNDIILLYGIIYCQYNTKYILTSVT